MDIDDKGNPKGIHVRLNGREVILHDESVSFEDLVSRAYPDGTQFSDPGFRVVFTDAVRPAEGDLKAGDTLKVKDGTVINVTSFDLS